MEELTRKTRTDYAEMVLEVAESMPLEETGVNSSLKGTIKRAVRKLSTGVNGIDLADMFAPLTSLAASKLYRETGRSEEELLHHEVDLACRDLLANKYAKEVLRQAIEIVGPLTVEVRLHDFVRNRSGGYSAVHSCANHMSSQHLDCGDPLLLDKNILREVGAAGYKRKRYFVTGRREWKSDGLYFFCHRPVFVVGGILEWELDDEQGEERGRVAE